MNFSKLEDNHGVNHKGTGLGLSICKTLIELMGGSVRVESQIGEGTSFIVSLKTKSQYQDKNLPLPRLNEV
jgi:signal transduction histidine kinase